MHSQSIRDQNINDSWDREGKSLIDTPGETQCDAVKFGANAYMAQLEPEHFDSAVSGCLLSFACHAKSTRSTSETSRKPSRSKFSACLEQRP